MAVMRRTYVDQWMAGEENASVLLARADAEIDRRERILRRALNADDTGDFDDLVEVVRAVDECRKRAEAKVAER